MNTRRDILAGLGLVALSACTGGKLRLGSGSDTDTGNPDGDTDTSGTDTTAATCQTDIGNTQIVLCIADYPKLATTNGSVVLNSHRGKLIAVRIDDTTVVTLSDICTHQGCQVAWRSSMNALYCPCHGSKFDTDGSVLHGPANRPLASYPTTLEDDTITIDIS